MNERFRELALQAGEYVNAVYTPPVRSKTPGKLWEDGHIDWHEQFNEKFAELIVRECSAYLSGAMEVHNQQEQDLMDLAARKIKQYFGVE